jgi:hypothetical protein
LEKLLEVLQSNWKALFCKIRREMCCEMLVVINCEGHR